MLPIVPPLPATQPGVGARNCQLQAWKSARLAPCVGSNRKLRFGDRLVIEALAHKMSCAGVASLQVAPPIVFATARSMLRPAGLSVGVVVNARIGPEAPAPGRAM